MTGAYGQKLAESTYETNEQFRQQHLNPVPIAKLRLSQISRTDVETWLSGIRVRKQKGKDVFLVEPQPPTLRRIHAYLSKLLSLAVRDNLIPYNPCAGVELPRVLPRPNRVLDLDEAKALFDPRNRTQAVMLVALLTGLRRSEVVRLKWENVTQESITVKAKKNSESVKAIPLASEAWSAIQAQPNRSDYVFTTETGLPLSPRNLNRDARAELAKLGLPANMRPLQDLRGSFGTLLIQSGADIKTVQDLLRHESATTTMRMYLRSSTPIKTAAITNLTKRLNPKKQTKKKA
jgi:integrase